MRACVYVCAYVRVRVCAYVRVHTCECACVRVRYSHVLEVTSALSTIVYRKEIER